MCARGVADLEAPTTPAAGPAAPIPMCYACGQVLKGGEAKCPACGAPTRTLRQARRSGRLSFAGFLLLALFIVTGLIAFTMLQAVTQDDLGTAGALGQSATLAGKVALQNQTDGSGVEVFSSLMPTNRTSTDGNGTYRLSGLPVGLHKIRFERDNFTTVELRLFIYQDMTADASLSEGNRSNVTVQNHGSYTSVTNVFNFCGAVFVAIALLELGGAFACFRRRNYLLALTGAVVSIVGSLPFLAVIFFGALILLVPFVLSVIATVIITRNKANFR